MKDTQNAMRGGRALMLAHHFPPAGGSGSNRALAFTRYLPAFGWRPIVVAPGAEWAANTDMDLLREVASTTRVVRTRSLEARPRGAEVTEREVRTGRSIAEWRRHLGHARRFPDAHIGWLPFALAAARRQRFDVAYSSSGPFTSHLVGLLLKRLERKPWVLELRDGWYRWNRAIFPDYPAWRDVLEARLEAAAIRSADRVVLVTERMARAFGAQYADLRSEHFTVVSNGFDPAQFACDDRPGARRDGWSVLHAGALYYGRSLTVLLEAVRRVRQTDPAFARDFRLRLLGTLDAAAAAEVRQAGLGDALEVLPQSSHAKAIAAMRAADALLLIANTTVGADATVPGKLFEYLAVGRPVLAVAPRESSTSDVLRNTGGGWLAEAGDAEAIACALRRAYAERTTPRDTAALARYDRRHLAGQLAAVFDEVVGAARER